MLKIETIKCRVCDLCGRIVEIPEVENFPTKELHEVENYRTGDIDEICDNCLQEKAFTCDECGNLFYGVNKFQDKGFKYCPACAKKKAVILENEYFNFIKRFKSWKAEQGEVEE